MTSLQEQVISLMRNLSFNKDAVGLCQTDGVQRNAQTSATESWIFKSESEPAIRCHAETTQPDAIRAEQLIKWLSLRVRVLCSEIG